MEFLVQFRKRCTFRGIEFIALCTNIGFCFGSKVGVLPFFVMAIDMKNGKWYYYRVVRERYTFRELPVFCIIAPKQRSIVP